MLTILRFLHLSAPKARWPCTVVTKRKDLFVGFIVLHYNTNTALIEWI